MTWSSSSPARRGRRRPTDDGQEFNNDYYIRNANPRLRSLVVVAGAPITVNTLSADETGDSTKDHPVTLSQLADYFTTDPSRAKASLFIITVKADRVTRIREQYLP